jgi:hypothetical protein
MQARTLQKPKAPTGSPALHAAVAKGAPRQITVFLGIEMVPDGAGPSPASGVSLEQYQVACEAQVDSDSDSCLAIWLFEPRRLSKVKHWSGTNEYLPWHQNKLGSTLNTFTHYAYLLSQETTVLADLQSIMFSVSFVALFSDQNSQLPQLSRRMAKESRPCLM